MRHQLMMSHQMTDKEQIPLSMSHAHDDPCVRSAHVEDSGTAAIWAIASRACSAASD